MENGLNQKLISIKSSTKIAVTSKQISAAKHQINEKYHSFVLRISKTSSAASTPVSKAA